MSFRQVSNQKVKIVDKTDRIFDLISNDGPRAYFLTRPAKFGKTLFTS